MDDFPWPDAGTLAAGDEDLVLDPDWLSRLEAAQKRDYQEDGALVLFFPPFMEDE